MPPTMPAHPHMRRSINVPVPKEKSFDSIENTEKERMTYTMPLNAPYSQLRFSKHLTPISAATSELAALMMGLIMRMLSIPSTCFCSSSADMTIKTMLHSSAISALFKIERIGFAVFVWLLI